MEENKNNPPADPANPPAAPTTPTEPTTPTAKPTSTPSEPTPTEPTTPPAKAARDISLLDDDDPPPADPPTPPTPDDEKVKAFVEGIPALDMGDGVKWDDQMLKVMAPSLMELTGGDPKKADGLVKAYSSHMQSIMKAQAEAADAFNNGLIAQCKERFGEDFQKVVAYAKQGGRAVFGEKIWNEMKKTPAFVNNPDIMEKLAEIGRKSATDGGKVLPQGSTPGERGDLLHRMYGMGAK